MKNTETKHSCKKVPVVCLILCVVLGPFNSTLGGFFLIVSFISFMVCRMQDNVPDTGATGYDLSDWDLPGDSEFMKFDVVSTGCGAEPASAGAFAEMQVTPTESIGKSYTDIW